LRNPKAPIRKTLWAHERSHHAFKKVFDSLLHRDIEFLWVERRNHLALTMMRESQGDESPRDKSSHHRVPLPWNRMSTHLGICLGHGIPLRDLVLRTWRGRRTSKDELRVVGSKGGYERAQHRPERKVKPDMWECEGARVVPELSKSRLRPVPEAECKFVLILLVIMVGYRVQVQVRGGMAGRTKVTVVVLKVRHHVRGSI
ncbi:hypothetical protein BJY52DRAFT_1231718, partial [Lactarius psammicola]